MLTKIGQQMFLKIGQQMFHTIETDGRQAGANQQMFLTYTLETADGHTIEARRPVVAPDRFFCLLFKRPLYHYLHTCTCMHIYIYKHTCIHIHACTHTYTYTTPHSLTTPLQFLIIHALSYDVIGLASKKRHNERATSRKSDKSKSVSKERQEYCRFELKIVFLMTKLTLILTQNDPYDG